VQKLLTSWCFSCKGLLPAEDSKQGTRVVACPDLDEEQGKTQNNQLRGTCVQTVVHYFEGF